MNPLRSLTLALSFMTRIPVGQRLAPTAQDLARAAAWYPMVGLLLGGLNAIVAQLGVSFLPQPLLLVVLLALPVWLTGAFHEDGLADSFDGLGGGHTPERALEIMKDSRIGTFGAMGLILLVLFRGALYLSIPGTTLPAALLVAPCFARLCVLPVQVALPYARREGIAPRPGMRELLLGAPVPMALCVWGGAEAWLALACSLVVALFCGAWMRERLKGFTGDTLGMTVCLCELGALAAFVSR